MRIHPLLATLLACALGAACSSQQSYATGQAWQQNECNKIIDMQDRERCMARTRESYDSYQRRVDDLKKNDRADWQGPP
jgi:membrane protein DedA with SNARE-associated domain